MDQTQIKAQLDKCDSQLNCTINFNDTAGNYNIFKSDADSSLISSDGNCGDLSYFYAQIPCTIPKQHTTIRKVFGLLIGCIAVFIYLFTVVYFDYISSVQKTKYVDWDVKTITAGDYTVEFDLDHE